MEIRYEKLTVQRYAMCEACDVDAAALWYNSVKSLLIKIISNCVIGSVRCVKISGMKLHFIKVVIPILMQYGEQLVWDVTCTCA